MEAARHENRSTPPPLPPEARRERPASGERRILHDTLVDSDLTPRAALEVMAGFDERELRAEETSKELGWILEEYGLTDKDLSDDARETAKVLYLGLKNGHTAVGKDRVAEALDANLHRHLVVGASRSVDMFTERVARSADLDELKDSLRATMRKIEALSRMVPVENRENADIWTRVDAAFTGIIHLKETGKAEAVDRAFAEVFDEFRDVIEDDILAHRIAQRVAAGETPEAEAAMRELYGLTAEEYEQRKRDNRVAVVEAIMEMKDRRIERSTLERLHEINNKGIVPKRFSKIRDATSDAGVAFGRRIGLFGEDTANETDLLVERMNWLSERAKADDVSSLEYAVLAARAHNDLLDIHPFPDRNGSTALLALELLMAKRGHVPSKERSSDFYAKIRDIFNNNPVPVAVVGYEMVKIKNVPGYFEGQSMPEERRKVYDTIVNLLQQREQARKDAGRDIGRNALKARLARLGRAIGFGGGEVEDGAPDRA